MIGKMPERSESPMKCPVCDQENPSMLCPRCGFDASRDYEKYPTFGIVRNVPAISALQAERNGGSRITEQEKQQLLSRVEELEQQMSWAVGEIQRLREKLGEPKSQTITSHASRAMIPVQADVAPKRNRLREDPLRMLSMPSLFHFSKKLQRDQIRSVTFLDTLADAPEDAWDVSADKSGSVRAWVVHSRHPHHDRLYLAADGKIEAPESCNGMFSGCRNMRRIHFGNCLLTSKVKNMSRMFSGCSSLAELDLSSFNTSNVQNMEGMFQNCSSLTELDLSSFHTSNVQNMASMFDNCSSLTKLDLTSFVTSEVENMCRMFSGCSFLTALDLSRFNTSRVQAMGLMFAQCSSLTELNLSSFDTSNVQDMIGMFCHCKSLTELDLSSFNTARVPDMRYMFKGCSSLTALKRSDLFVTPKTQTDGMFDSCPAGGAL